jgi:hypothetical protein
VIVRLAVRSTDLSYVYPFSLKGNIPMVRQSRWHQRQGSQCTRKCDILPTSLYVVDTTSVCAQ